ncbi:hypothetical protein ACHAWF_011990 [Thalassiosira exigua]
MYGYGGFGYDTSHVPRDEAKSELTQEVERGNLAAVRQIVEDAASKSEEEKQMSGFVNEHEWFDITPLATAASKGRHEFVQFLLEQGADPTLRGCPYDDVYWNALEAANHMLLRAERTAGPRRCVDLLKVANLFWEKAAYSGPHYSNNRKLFSNRPTTGEGLARALTEVPSIGNYPHGCLTEENLKRLKEKYGKIADATATGSKNAGFAHGAHRTPNVGIGSITAFPSKIAAKTPVNPGINRNVNAADEAGAFHFGTSDANNGDTVTKNTFNFGSSTVAPFAMGGFAPNKQKSKPSFNFGNDYGLNARTTTTPKAGGRISEPSPTSALEVLFPFSPVQPVAFGSSKTVKPATAFAFGASPTKASGGESRISFGASTSACTSKVSPQTFAMSSSSRGFSQKFDWTSKPAQGHVTRVPLSLGSTSTTAAPSPPIDPPSSKTNSKSMALTVSTPSSHADTRIAEALALLESVPSTSLTQYSDRLQKLAHTAHVLSGAPTTKAVFDNDLLLGHILRFEGSLAYYHKHYDMIVGYESPLPYDWSNKHSDIPGARGTTLCEGLMHRRGTAAHALVCKKWKSFVVGDAGWARWKIDSEDMVAKKISIAKITANDTSLSWSARICAAAVANDINALKSAFKNPGDESTGIGVALAEQRDEKFVIGREHPFYRHCVCNMVDEDVYYDDFMYAFTASIAYAAALAGSTDALRVIEPLSGALWRIAFGQKGEGLLDSLVKAACRNPTLDCIVKSISFILSKYNSKCDRGNSIHQRIRGGNGNYLHLAAARGHGGLVKALIDGGMQPNRACERIEKDYYNDYGDYCSYDDDDDSYDDYDSDSSDRSEKKYGDLRDKGVTDHPLPVHWASIRGHQSVVKLIYTMNGWDNRVKERGHAKAFNHARGFGFIKRENGGKDIFVHISNIEDEEPLDEGEYVEFTTGQTPRGFQALDVTRV